MVESSNPWCKSFYIKYDFLRQSRDCSEKHDNGGNAKLLYNSRNYGVVL